MFTKTILSVGALAFISVSHAHVVMNTPKPYGFSSLQTAPLNGDNYQFPCQSGSRANAFDIEGSSTPMSVGQDNDLKFTGSAVHGGGSCQLSITYEYPPPDDKSKWKVIHSYIGGCPAEAAGNLQPNGDSDANKRPDGVQCTGDDQTECMKQYKFQIPEGMKNGNATLAWTWFNKVGNREMYMNCAPISISGGSDDDTYFNSLPEIFVANVPGMEGACNTNPGVVEFPNPGDSVIHGEEATPDALGNCPAGSSSGSSGNSTSSSGSGSSSSATSSSYAAPTYGASSSYAAPIYGASSSYAASSAYGAPSSAAPVVTYQPEQNLRTSAAAVDPEPSTVQQTTMLTQTGYASAASSSAVVATSAAGSYVAPPQPTAASTGFPSARNGTCEDAGKVSCPSPGEIMCINETEFGLCNIDYCAFPEALADGTSCKDGVINKHDVVRRSSSRFHRHAHGHAHKRSF